MLRAKTARTFSASQFPKIVHTRFLFYILTSKCAPLHQWRALFDIATSKSWANMVSFVHVSFKMCFAPQWPVLFRHLKFQKWSGGEVFVHFYLHMCFGPQRRGLFLQLNFHKWSDPGVFCAFFTSNCTARRNGVQLFISSVLFDHPDHKYWKNTVIRCLPTFLRTCIFSLLTFSLSDLFPISSSPV